MSVPETAAARDSGVDSPPRGSGAGVPPLTLDHLVWAGPSLADLVAEFERLTGVVPAPGGVHPTGTANALVAFTVAGARGPHYLELIGPDPARAGGGPVMTFGIDRLTGPRLATFAVHPDDIEATVSRARAGGYDPGDVRPLSRTKPDGTVLAWRLTRPAEQAPSPVLPFLIDWGATEQPGVGELPSVELVSLRGEHPDPDSVARVLGLLGVDLDVGRADEPALVAVVRGADGEAELR